MAHHTLEEMAGKIKKILWAGGKYIGKYWTIWKINGFFSKTDEKNAMTYFRWFVQQNLGGWVKFPMTLSYDGGKSHPAISTILIQGTQRFIGDYE